MESFLKMRLGYADDLFNNEDHVQCLRICESILGKSLEYENNLLIKQNYWLIIESMKALKLTNVRYRNYLLDFGLFLKHELNFFNYSHWLWHRIS